MRLVPLVIRHITHHLILRNELGMLSEDVVVVLVLLGLDLPI
jgi:hypothetical protein